MSRIVSGNTDAPSVMIGERGAEFLAADMKRSVAADLFRLGYPLATSCAAMFRSASASCGAALRNGE